MLYPVLPVLKFLKLPEPMKKHCLLFFCFFTFLTLPALARNILGGELTYTCIAPGIYNVKFRYVQDCATTPIPSVINLNLKAPGCNPTGRTVTLNPVSMGNNVLLQNYCPKTPTPNCAPFNQPGIAILNVFQGVVTFSAAEQTCQNWILSVTVDSETRANSANLVANAPFYLEALVKFGTAGGTAINNNSVEFSPLNLPYQFTYANQNTTYNLNAAESDGDSLVFSLRPAMQASGSAASYKPGFSALDPFATTPPANLDSNSGELIIPPVPFVPNGQPNQGLNRYTTVVQIDEYRFRHGVRELIGYTQRDMMFEFQQPLSQLNSAPDLADFRANGQPFSPLTPLVLTAGQPVKVTFNAFDPDSLDMVKLEMDTMNMVVNGLAKFKILNAFTRPQVEIKFTPASSHVQATPYYLPIKLEDDACPIKAIATKVLMFEVQAALGAKPEISGPGQFKAVPNPFSERVSFQVSGQTNPEELVIFNLLGQEIDRIKVFVNESLHAEIPWENAGKHAAGTYLAKLISAEKTIQTLKFSKVQ